MTTDRRCKCHGLPMDAHSTCAVKRRARQLLRHHADAPAKNYARSRRRLRARIAYKRRLIDELEGTCES